MTVPLGWRWRVVGLLFLFPGLVLLTDCGSTPGPVTDNPTPLVEMIGSPPAAVAAGVPAQQLFADWEALNPQFSMGPVTSISWPMVRYHEVIIQTDIPPVRVIWLRYREIDPSGVPVGLTDDVVCGWYVDKSGCRYQPGMNGILVSLPVPDTTQAFDVVQATWLVNDNAAEVSTSWGLASQP